MSPRTGVGVTPRWLGLLALSAVAVVVLDILESLSRLLLPLWTPILAVKLVVYGVFGFFLVRGGAGAARAMAAVAFTAVVDIGIGWSVAPIVVYGPATVFATPMPIPTYLPEQGFGTPSPILVVYQRAESPAVSIATGLLRYCAAGAAGIAVGWFARKVRRA